MFFGGKSKESSETSGAIKTLSTVRQPRLSFSRVYKIFPDLPTKTLCTLLDLPLFSPLDVHAVIPHASSDQLAKFFDIVEENIPSQDLPMEEVKDKGKLAKSDCNKKDLAETAAGCNKKINHDDNVLLPNDTVLGIKCLLYMYWGLKGPG